jgi:hypothetical protein
MDLDQGSQPEGPCQSQELGQFRVVEGRDDQQDGVRPHRAGIADIERGHREVLAQHREPAGGPGGPEVGTAPTEELLVGEDR